jgi:hypothetical protein
LSSLFALSSCSLAPRESQSSGISAFEHFNCLKRGVSFAAAVQQFRQFSDSKTMPNGDPERPQQGVLLYPGSINVCFGPVHK